MSFLTGSSSPRGRIGLSVAATGLGRVVGIAYNFFLVPILLSAWGVQVYGEWVVLSALASMANLSNVGFIQASVSEIIMKVAANERDETGRILSTTLAGLLVLAVIVFAAAAAFLSLINSAALFGVKVIPLPDVRLVVELSLASVLLGFFPGALSAPVSAIAGAGVTQGIMTIAKFAELAAIIVLALFRAGPVIITAIPVASALVTSLSFVVLTRRIAPWLKMSPTGFDRATFRRLLHPSLGQFLLYASANVFAIQIPRLLLGHLAGAESVTAYSIAVTYTRTAKMLTSTLAQSFQVEITRAYGASLFARTVRFVEIICQLGGWMTAFASIGLLVLAGPLFHLWTRGKVDADYVLITFLALAAIISAYYEGFTYLLSGINRVWSIALGYSSASLSALMVCYWAFPWLGLHGFAATLVMPELTVAIVGLFETARILKTPARSLLAASLKLPIESLRTEILRAMALFGRNTR